MNSITFIGMIRELQFEVYIHKENKRFPSKVKCYVFKFLISIMEFDIKTKFEIIMNI